MISVEISTCAPYYTLKTANLVSLGKRANIFKFPGDTEEYEYYKKCFIARHSTIEWLHFFVIDDYCRGDVSAHIVRHTKGHPRFVVQSRRPDWTGEERQPLDKTYGMFASEWTPLSWMQMCEQRLCMNAKKETREWVQDVIYAMRNTNSQFFRALADCSVAQCVLRGDRCPELKSCGLREKVSV